MTSAAIYIRQTESGPTPEEQRAECWVAIEEKGWSGMMEFVDRESFTGKPGAEYQSLLNAIRTKRIERVVAYDAERMFRTTDAMIQLFDFARVGGVHFLFVKDQLTTEGVHGAYLVHSARLVAKIHQRRKSAQTSATMRRRALMGLPVGRPSKMTAALREQVDDLCDQGVPITVIAGKMGLSRGMVRWYLNSKKPGRVKV